MWGRQNAQGEAVHKEIPGMGEAPVLGSWDGEGRCDADETWTLAKVVCYLLFSAEHSLLQLHLPPGTEALSFLKVIQLGSGLSLFSRESYLSKQVPCYSTYFPNLGRYC